MNSKISLSLFITVLCMFYFITLDTSFLLSTTYLSASTQKLIILFLMVVSAYLTGRFHEEYINTLNKLNLSGKHLGK